jgi:hypothetical protein
MPTGKTIQKSATNCRTLEGVLQCYVVAGLFSTSGLDVLLVMTVVFLLFASLRQAVELLSRGHAALSYVADAAP